MRRTLTNRRPQSVWDFMNDINSVFDNSFQGTASSQWNGAFEPAVDIQETQDSYLLSFDVPGIHKDQIKIDLHDGTLIVSGERSRETTKQNGEGFHRTERSYGKFERRFQLPSKIDSDKVQARHENGVLEIMVPKAETVKTKSIKIDNGGSLFSKLIGGNSKESNQH